MKDAIKDAVRSLASDFASFESVAAAETAGQWPGTCTSGTNSSRGGAIIITRARNGPRMRKDVAILYKTINPSEAQILVLQGPKFPNKGIPQY